MPPSAIRCLLLALSGLVAACSPRYYSPLPSAPALVGRAPATAPAADTTAPITPAGRFAPAAAIISPAQPPAERHRLARKTRLPAQVPVAARPAWRRAMRSVAARQQAGGTPATITTFDGSVFILLAYAFILIVVGGGYLLYRLARSLTRGQASRPHSPATPGQ